MDINLSDGDWSEWVLWFNGKLCILQKRKFLLIVTRTSLFINNTDSERTEGWLLCGSKFNFSSKPITESPRDSSRQKTVLQVSWQFSGWAEPKQLKYRDYKANWQYKESLSPPTIWQLQQRVTCYDCHIELRMFYVDNNNQAHHVPTGDNPWVVPF